MHTKIAMVVLAAALAVGCGSSDLHMMARFTPTEGRPALMAVIPVNDGPYACTVDGGEYRIMLAGSGVELQRLVRPEGYPGVEKYEAAESVHVSQTDFLNLRVGSPKPRVEVVIADRAIVADEAQRLGGNLFRCVQYTQ